MLLIINDLNRDITFIDTVTTVTNVTVVMVIVCVMSPRNSMISKGLRSIVTL